MTVVFGTVGLLVALNAIGLAISLRLDQIDIPDKINARTVRRKPGTLRKRLPLIGLNLCLLIGLTTPALILAQDVFTLELPTLALGLGHFGLLVFVDDLWFYFFHRVLHENRFLYRKIHKRHHEAYAPVPIEYIYVHPLEWLGGGIGPAIGIGSIIIIFGEMSAYTLWFWGFWRTLHELDIHSGIASQLGRFVPLFADTTHHDIHHARPTQGNYASSLTLWDKMFRTEASRNQPARNR